MSFTKVAPAGIGTEPGTSILIGDSLLHSTGIDIGSNTGIGVTIRKHGDATFTGIITASAFFGDGSGLEGVSSSGIGTPLSDDDTSTLNKVYYVNQELSIGSTVTVNHPDSAVASYTHYQDLVVKDDADFIVTDGDTFIPDVLGIRTDVSTTSPATGGRIRAGTITNAGANGAPNFPNGLTVTGVITSTTLNANVSGDLTVTGNLGVGGTVTYEDVTNVDSIGIITARSTVSIADSIIHTGDTNTSLRFPSADTITAETGGLERLRINSAGALLLGTSTHSNLENLHIHTASSDKAIIKFTNTGTGQATGDGFEFGLNSNEDVELMLKENHDIIFGTGASTAERLRITSTGIINAPTQAGFYARMQNTKSNVMGGGASYYTIPFDTDSGSICYDQHNSYDTSTGLYTVPTGGTGYYMLATAVCLSSNVYGRGGECWFIQGSNRYFFDRRFMSNAGSGTITGFYGTNIIYLSAGQTIGVQGFISGGSTDVDVQGAAASDQITWFTARKIA